MIGRWGVQAKKKSTGKKHLEGKRLSCKEYTEELQWGRLRFFECGLCRFACNKRKRKEKI